MEKDTVQITFTKEGAKVATHMLNRYIKGIATTPDAIRVDKLSAFYLMQVFLPHCEWEEGEEKIIVSSREQLDKFL